MIVRTHKTQGPGTVEVFKESDGVQQVVMTVSRLSVLCTIEMTPEEAKSLGEVLIFTAENP